MLFAGKELYQNIAYLSKQGKELNLSINYPKRLDVLVKFYIRLFGIPEIGFQERFDFFQRAIKKLEGAKFIDAGCGNGAYSRFIAEKFSQSRIFSFDSEKKIVTLARRLTSQKNVSYYVYDLTKKRLKPFKNADIVWSLDVLEHIKDYKKAVKNLASMVKRGGYLILHVPLVNQRRWIPYFNKWTHETHEREGFRRKEISELLRNFKILREINTFGALGSLIWEINIIIFKKFPLFAILFFPILRIAMLFDKIIPSGKYNCFGILAQKK